MEILKIEQSSVKWKLIWAVPDISAIVVAWVNTLTVTWDLRKEDVEANELGLSFTSTKFGLKKYRTYNGSIICMLHVVVNGFLGYIAVQSNGYIVHS